MITFKLHKRLPGTIQSHENLKTLTITTLSEIDIIMNKLLVLNKEFLALLKQIT
jgi:hypothetical protein